MHKLKQFWEGKAPLWQVFFGYYILFGTAIALLFYQLIIGYLS